MSMSVATPTMPPATSVVPGGYLNRRFTCDEYVRMTELGFFASQRVELIGGDILVRTPIGNRHAIGIELLRVALAGVFGTGFWVRIRMTLDLAPHGMPDPDVAVVVGGLQAFGGRQGNPTTAELVVEVSETTLATDRTRKASLYAAAGIREYWILNLVGDVLEVRRDPQPDTTAEFGLTYGSVTNLRTGDTVSPLAMPAARIAVADLLPV